MFLHPKPRRGLCLRAALAAAAALATLGLARWALRGGEPVCTVVLEVALPEGTPARFGCIAYYQAGRGEDGEEQELDCVYHEDEHMRGPCRFNTSRLACAFPTAARLAAAPHGRGCRGRDAAAAAAAPAWGTLQAIREAAADWRAGPQPGVPASAPAAVPPLRRAHPTAPGRWAASRPRRGAGWAPGVAFSPAASERCPPEATSALELVGWARATGIRRLVMSGDSSLRQLYQRGITLARAEPVTVDVVGQRFAHYEVCWHAPPPAPDGRSSRSGGELRDALWFSVDTYPTARRKDPEKVAARITRAHINLVAHTRPRWEGAEAAGLAAGAEGQQGSGDGGSGGGESDERSADESPEQEQQEQQQQQQQQEEGCGGQRELVLDLVMGTLRGQQQENLRWYVRDVMGVELGGPGGPGPGPAQGDGGAGGGSWEAQQRQQQQQQQREETAFVLAACYWHTGPSDAHLWPEYQQLIWQLRGYARHVVLVTCPVVPGMKDAHAEVLRSRNADLAALVAKDTSGALRLLDAALMVSNVPLKFTIAEQQYHFACSFVTSNGGASGPVRYPQHDGVGPEFFDAVRATQDGRCEDSVNYSLWQALMCLLGAGQKPL